jgi:hypothetical protein
LNGLNTPAIQSALLFSGLSAFVIVFGAYGFIAPWGGDINVHLAAVHALYRNMWNPADLSLDVHTSYSVFFSPYTVLVAAVGQMLGITPYHALQLAGIFNIALYACAIALFCRTFSAVPKSPLPPLLFLAVSLFLRSKVYSWSSETSYPTLSITQAYPSMLGWALALFAFVAAEHVARKHSAAAIVGLALLIALLVLAHPLTASWSIGIVGLRALYLFATATTELRREGRFALTALPSVMMPSLALTGALALGIALSLLWPYYSPLGLGQLAGLQQNDEFGSNPFSGIPATYLLAIAALLLSARLSVYRFWIVAFVATWGALELLRTLGIALADRYAFFMGFFAQFIVADCAAAALTQFFSARGKDAGAPRGRRAMHGVYLALFAIAFVYSPVLHAPLRSGILSLRAWREGQPGERAYYSRWEPIRAAIHPGEVLMMAPAFEEGFAIPAVTGAKVIAAVVMDGVPDAEERTRAVQRFFTAGQKPEVRRQDLKRWRATKVVLIAPTLNLAGEMEALLGPPVWRDQTHIVFTVEPERLSWGSSRAGRCVKNGWNCDSVYFNDWPLRDDLVGERTSRV